MPEITGKQFIELVRRSNLISTHELQDAVDELIAVHGELSTMDTTGGRVRKLLPR